MHDGTQNANELFHHLLWERCPKLVFGCRDRLEIAVREKYIVFNDGEIGKCEIFHKLGLYISKIQNQCFHFFGYCRDRVKSAEYQATASNKRKRDKRNMMAALEGGKDDTYQAGGLLRYG